MIYADENVWKPVVDGVRRRGWDITSANEEGTLGYDDSEHFEYATERGRTILTFDDDFLRLAKTEFEDREHYGVVFIPQHKRGVGELVQRIDTALRREEDNDLSGRIVYA